MTDPDPARAIAELIGVGRHLSRTVTSATGCLTMFLKICGITRLARRAARRRSRRDALGFVFWPRSPRYIDAGARAASIVAALPPTVTTVGVFVNEPVEAIRERWWRDRHHGGAAARRRAAGVCRALEWPLLRVGDAGRR